MVRNIVLLIFGKRFPPGTELFSEFYLPSQPPLCRRKNTVAVQLASSTSIVPLWGRAAILCGIHRECLTCPTGRASIKVKANRCGSLFYVLRSEEKPALLLFQFNKSSILKSNPQKPHEIENR